MKDLIRLARELDMPLVATNDLHYTRPEDAKAHSALLCVQSGSTMMDPTRFKFDADDFYLKSPAEMRHTWRELPEACDNTLLIAEMCEISFTEDEGRYMPRFPCPPGRERGELVHQGGRSAACASASPSGIPDYAQKQAEFETEVIVSKGYAGYFLVVADFINWAKKQRHPGRSGSWLGCRLDVRLRHEDHRPRPDPARPDLRAVPQPRARPRCPTSTSTSTSAGAARSSATSPRSTASDRVAQIVTYGTIKAKQAVKDAARVMGHPFAVGEQLTKAMPPDVMGKGVPLVGHLRPGPQALRRGRRLPRPGRRPSRTCRRSSRPR